MEFRFRSGDRRHPLISLSSSSDAYIALRREIKEMIRDEMLREEVRREMESEGLASTRLTRYEKFHDPMARVGLRFGLDGKIPFPLNSSHKIRGFELRSEAPPSNQVQGTKRKAIVNPGSSEWNCAICQVTVTSEASLNDHLQGKKHKAKLTNCSVDIAADKKNEAKLMPIKGQKRITLEVDGKMHQVLQRKKLLWCERCKIKCRSTVTMVAHLRGKKHSSQHEEKVDLATDAVEEEGY